MNTRPLVFLACVTLLTAYVLRSGVGSNPLIREGSKAPDFTLKTEDGRQVSLAISGEVWSSSISGERIVCPARRRCPTWRPLREFSGKEDFHMMPVSLDIDTSEVSRFYRERALTMPAYLDPGRNVASLYDIRGTPETFIIDMRGKSLRSTTSDHRSGRARRCSPGWTN